MNKNYVKKQTKKTKQQKTKQNIELEIQWRLYKIAQ